MSGRTAPLGEEKLRLSSLQFHGWFPILSFMSCSGGTKPASSFFEDFPKSGGHSHPLNFLSPHRSSR